MTCPQYPLRYPLLTLAALSLLAGDANAQGGQLDERTRYGVVTGTGQSGRHGPLLAVVLWRGAPGWDDAGQAERVRADSVFRWAQLRASEANLSFFGTGLAYGLVARDYREVIVEGRRFPLGAGDSALVVMVTIPANGVARVVTSARIRAAAVPDAFWPRSWQSGDTTFMVHPRYPRDADLLRTALLESPAVAAYLR
jgi:hypothetical protein